MKEGKQKTGENRGWFEWVIAILIVVIYFKLTKPIAEAIVGVAVDANRVPKWRREMEKAEEEAERPVTHGGLVRATTLGRSVAHLIR